MVRVLVDATALPADRRGVGRYIDSLLPALARAGATVQVACQPRDGAEYGAMAGVEVVVASAMTGRRATRMVWEQVGLPATIRRLRPDVVHSPHYTHPLLSRTPQAVTIHDATFFTDPGVHTGIKGPFFRAATRLALRRADCCIVVSQATSAELQRAVGADPERIQVAHLGVDQATFHPPTLAAVAAVRDRLGLPAGAPYVAFLGTIEPRKNISALIEGWVAAARGRAEPPALVIAGGAGWNTDLDAIAVPTSLRLIRPGYLPIGELAGLLGGAEIVAYPSLGEGFGLPVLEGMACGGAVLTTRRLALPEVGGEAVAYTEPDAPAIAAAITGLLDDSPRRDALRAAAVERAAGFTWDASAAAHLVAYERAIAAARHG